MMRRIFSGASVFFALLLGCDKLKETPSAPGPIHSTIPWSGQAIAADTFIKISRRADPSVVNIGTTKIVKQAGPHPFFSGPQGRAPFEEFFGDEFFRRFFGEPEGEDAPETKQQSLGSGFILDPEGYIVTNNHVIDKADEITVTIGADHEYKAKVVGVDPKTDLALIQVNAKEKLVGLALGDSDQLQVGEIVVAIGNPFGLSHTVTQGIVSAKERTIGFGPYDNFIQTDASINPGNSGGPLLNLSAEVVGINAAIAVSPGQAIGFAIPINLAKDVIAQLKSKGSVTRGWLGVYIQKVDPDLAKSLGLKEHRGALVSSVQKGSPADKAGLKQGDVITRFNGKEIHDFNELPRFVASTRVGEKARVGYTRNGKTLSVDVVIGELKPTAEESEERSEETEDSRPSKIDHLGLAVRSLTPEIAQSLGIPPGTKGVVVDRVAPDKPAYDKGIRHGDVVVQVNRKDVPDVKTYRTITQALKKGDSVLLLVRRGGEQTLFIAFTL